MSQAVFYANLLAVYTFNELLVHVLSLFWIGLDGFVCSNGGWFSKVLKVLIACVLLVTFLDVFSFENKFTILDFYAGAGRLARGGRTLGLDCRACLPKKLKRMSMEFEGISLLGITFNLPRRPHILCIRHHLCRVPCVWHQHRCWILVAYPRNAGWLPPWLDEGFQVGSQ